MNGAYFNGILDIMNILLFLLEKLTTSSNLFYSILMTTMVSLTDAIQIIVKIKKSVHNLISLLCVVQLRYSDDKICHEKILQNIKAICAVD